jgi:hypothetical protein
MRGKEVIMNGKVYRIVILEICAAATLLLSSSISVRAQEAPKPAPASAAPSNPPTAPPSDLTVLADLIRQLQTQVQTLTAKVGELQAEEQSSKDEARELRQEIAAAKAQLAALNGGSPSSGAPVAAIAVSGPTPPQSSVASHEDANAQDKSTIERLDKIEEVQQVDDAKINDQNQTKVESGSKYRLRLSGIVLLNLFENRGPVDNLDFPELAVASVPPTSGGAFGGSLRQSQITLEGFGPDIAGAKTSANITFDFAGGIPDSSYGATTGLVRLRTGTMRLDWENTSIVAGQDELFFAPLYPTSFASLAVPALSYAGELWSWSPQVRVEHRIHFSDVSTLLIQAGIMDSLTAENPATYYNRVPTAGESSGQPAYAGRAAWSHRAFGQNLTIGLGAYYGRQNWGFGQKVNSWAATTDITLPLGNLFELTGEFYRGHSIGGIGGGIGQSIVATGMLGNSATDVDGLDTEGGWAQLKFKPRQKLEMNLAFGQDNPYAKELRVEDYYWSQNYYYSLLSKNWAGFANVIYHPRSDVVLALEYRRLRTFESQDGFTMANITSLSVGYIF